MGFKYNPLTGNLDLVGSASSGANTDLSNLTPTNINQSLLFDADGSYDIGSTTNRVSQIATYTTIIYDDIVFDDYSNSQSGKFQSYDAILPSGDTAKLSIYKNSIANDGIFGIYSQNRSSTENSTNIQIETGNVVDGIAGDIKLRSGTVSGTGTRGGIYLNDYASIKAFTGAPLNWGSSLPGLVLDASNTEISSVIGCGLFLDGDGSQSDLAILSKDTSGAVASSNFYFSTGVNSGTANSGNITLRSGDCTGASGTTGDILITSGNSNANDSGNILLTTGVAGSNRGSVTLDSASVITTSQPFVDFVVQSGTTGSRPSGVLGKMFFDTTLGIPIWYDGTNWVDATGATV